MINYEILDESVDGYNFTAKKIRFNDKIITDEHGEIKEAVSVDSTGLNDNIALFVDDELFIEGLTLESIMWRLAEVSTNLELQIVEK